MFSKPPAPHTFFSRTVFAKPRLNSYNIQAFFINSLSPFFHSLLLTRTKKQEPIPQIMLYQSLALLAVTLTFASAIPTQAAKRDFVNDANGNIKLTCTYFTFFSFITVTSNVEGERRWGVKKKRRRLT